MNRALRRTRILGFLVLGVVAGILWFLLLGPRFDEPNRLAQSEQDSLAQKVNLDRQVSVLERREEYLPQAEQVNTELTGRFPTTGDTSVVIDAVINAGAAAGMDASQIPTIIPAKPTAEGVSKDIQAQAARIFGGPAPDQPADGESEGDNKPSGPTATLSQMPMSIGGYGTLAQINALLDALRESSPTVIVDRAKFTARQAVAVEGEPAPPTGMYDFTLTTHVLIVPQTVPAPEVTPVRKTGAAAPSTAPAPSGSSTPSPSTN